ncbi:MAG: hypothetical protein ACTSQE_08945 [Candidatus Heimdallarchaeaceae archaeon]
MKKKEQSKSISRKNLIIIIVALLTALLGFFLWFRYGDNFYLVLSFLTIAFVGYYIYETKKR